MNEENIGEVFGISARICKDSADGRMYCIPRGRKNMADEDDL